MFTRVCAVPATADSHDHKVCRMSHPAYCLLAGLRRGVLATLAGRGRATGSLRSLDLLAVISLVARLATSPCTSCSERCRGADCRVEVLTVSLPPLPCLVVGVVREARRCLSHTPGMPVVCAQCQPRSMDCELCQLTVNSDPCREAVGEVLYKSVRALPGVDVGGRRVDRLLTQTLQRFDTAETDLTKL